MEEKINKLYAEKSKNFTEDEIFLIKDIIKQLNKGRVRVSEKKEESWIVNEWVKKSILLYFIISKNYSISNAPEDSIWFDKIKNKFTDWSEEHFSEEKLRAVPLSYVRYGAYLANNVILMPSFINIGAFIDSGTMIDSGVTVGSCAQIGKKCHISSNVVIGGVLEPLQEAPVIVENDCFIGAGSNILEGVIIREGSVIAAGCTISKTTKIVNRETGKITYGEVPAFSVVVPGTLAGGNNISLACAVIVKQVNSQTKAKTSINELLRY